MRSLAALALAAATLFSSGAARAYCFSTACKDVDACDGEEIPGCPTLVWKSGCVGFAVHDRGGSGLSAETVSLITDLAFQTWQSADCGAGPPGIVVQDMGVVECGAVEYNKDAGNANIVLFNDSWTHSETSHTYALTTTTFDPDTGALLNADIELNSRDHNFTVNDDAVEADLLSVLTHETGHFLGLAHAATPDATMYAYYDEGTTELRTLSDDDVSAICVRYPSDPSLDASCNPLPKHGFSPYCRDDQPEGSCSLTSPGADRGAALGGRFALVAACVAWARRRRVLTTRSAGRSRAGCR